MKSARFEVYKSKDGYRWRLLAGNNRTVASGEAHTRYQDAFRAAYTAREIVLEASPHIQFKGKL